MNRKAVAKELLAVARDLMAAAPGLDDVLQTLEQLDQLSDNLTDAIDTFQGHFKQAALDPSVKTQLDIMNKAKAGLDAAKNALKAVEAVLAAYPDDKTAARAKYDAEVMVKRFKRHYNDALDIYRTLSKKAMPPGLKAYASSIASELKSRLVDPSVLYVGHGQTETVFNDMYYHVLFKLTAGDRDLTGIAYEQVNKNEGPRANMGNSFHNGMKMSPKEFADQFFDSVRGWIGLKSETSDVRQQRSENVQNVKSILNQAVKRAGGWMIEEAQLEDETRVTAAYRSDSLPKEGAQEVGESDYQAMVEEVTGRFRKIVMPMLQGVPGIRKVGIYAGEKSWVYVTVELK